MKKYEYLSELEKRLSVLPEAERRDALNYYEEYFDAAGTDNEDATAAELGDPAEAARKILEGEGLTPDTAPEEQPQTAPAAPEPPAAEPPKRGPKANTMWLIFAVVIVVALLVQLAVLVLNFAKPSGGTASMTIAQTDEGAAASGLVRTEDFYNESTATEGTDNGGTSKNMDFTAGLADAKNITFDIDYGTVTVVVDSGAAEPTLTCMNLRQDWLTFTNTGDSDTSPVYVSYKTPANYNLSQDLGTEPQFILSVPDADDFRFTKLSITAAMGDVEFDNSNTIAADSIDLDLAMGNFTGSTVQAGQFTADVSMGNFDLGLLAGVQTAKVEAAMGNIGLTMDGKPDDYALDLQTSLGDVVFNGLQQGSQFTQNTTAPRSVTLTASMGDVVLTTTQ